LKHPVDSIRSWTVRFVGDARKASPEIEHNFVSLAKRDSSPLVVTQLACTAKRLPAADGLPILAAIASRDEWASDPYIPLLCWWGVEAHALNDTQQTFDLFASPAAWKHKIVRDVIVERLIQRAAAERTDAAFALCAKIIESAPESAHHRLLEFLDRGLAMVPQPKREGLPLGTAFTDLAVKEATTVSRVQRFDSTPPQFEQLLKTYFSADSTEPTIIRLATRLGNNDALERAWALALDRKTIESTRLTMFDIVKEFAVEEESVAKLLPLLGGEESPAVQAKVMTVLSRFADDRIPARVAEIYPHFDKPLRAAARELFFARADWAVRFLQEVDDGKYPTTEVTTDELRRLALHRDKRIEALVHKHWGEIRSGTPEEKLAEIRRLNNDLRAASGETKRGHELFKKHCGICHQLHGEGTKIGPDLTSANRHDRDFLLVSLVDPNAQIRKEFLNYIVVTTDGRILTGLLLEQTAAEITIVGAKNERTTIARGDIEEMKESPVSLMPEDVLKTLGPQDMRDLFAYLQK
jgi:putative heme-binding domain-containing protein